MTKKAEKPEELTDVSYSTIGSAVVQVLIGPDHRGLQMWLEVARVQLSMEVETIDGGASIAHTQQHKVAVPMTGVFRISYVVGNMTALSTEPAVEMEEGTLLPIGVAPATDV